MAPELDPASLAVGAAVPALIWLGSKLLGGLRNHAHRDSSVRGLKVAHQNTLDPSSGSKGCLIHIM